NNIACFDYPDEAVRYLNKYYRWSRTRSLTIQFKEKDINEERKNKVLKIINKAKEEERNALYFEEAKRIMDLYDIKASPVWEILPGTNNNQAGISFPVALKVDSDKILHKTEKKALILDIKNEEELEKAISLMRSGFSEEKLIIQPMLERKTELILGIKKDEVFGPAVVYGLGGIYTEIFKAVNFLIPPTDSEEIEREIRKSKISFLFWGARGQAPYNIEELSDILQKISFLAQEIGEIKEFDINPLLIYNDGKEAVAVDVKIII
ncbi:MAG TPA: acetate--CoA ligase family protein, partial [Patescibacteria group bacterium]|nr:acetate--CoA ligase family protein [Patescibacteria group bacterium]